MNNLHLNQIRALSERFHKFSTFDRGGRIIPHQDDDEFTILPAPSEGKWGWVDSLLQAKQRHDVDISAEDEMDYIVAKMHEKGIALVQQKLKWDSEERVLEGLNYLHAWTHLRNTIHSSLKIGFPKYIETCSTGLANLKPPSPEVLKDRRDRITYITTAIRETLYPKVVARVIEIEKLFGRLEPEIEKFIIFVQSGENRSNLVIKPPLIKSIVQAILSRQYGPEKTDQSFASCLCSDICELRYAQLKKILAHLQNQPISDEMSLAEAKKVTYFEEMRELQTHYSVLATRTLEQGKRRLFPMGDEPPPPAPNWYELSWWVSKPPEVSVEVELDVMNKKMVNKIPKLLIEQPQVNEEEKLVDGITYLREWGNLRDKIHRSFIPGWTAFRITCTTASSSSETRLNQFLEFIQTSLLPSIDHRIVELESLYVLDTPIELFIAYMAGCKCLDQLDVPPPLLQGKVKRILERLYGHRPTERAILGTHLQYVSELTCQQLNELVIYLTIHLKREEIEWIRDKRETSILKYVEGGPSQYNDFSWYVKKVRAIWLKGPVSTAIDPLKDLLTLTSSGLSVYMDRAIEARREGYYSKIERFALEEYSLRIAQCLIQNNSSEQQYFVNSFNRQGEPTCEYVSKIFEIDSFLIFGFSPIPQEDNRAPHTLRLVFSVPTGVSNDQIKVDFQTHKKAILEALDGFLEREASSFNLEFIGQQDSAVVAQDCLHLLPRLKNAVRLRQAIQKIDLIAFNAGFQLIDKDQATAFMLLKDKGLPPCHYTFIDQIHCTDTGKRENSVTLEQNFPITLYQVVKKRDAVLLTENKQESWLKVHEEEKLRPYRLMSVSEVPLSYLSQRWGFQQ